MTWPDPNATALDRARQIARTYRAALVYYAPEAALRLDDAAHRVDEAWVCGVTIEDRACTVREAALILGVTVGRVRQLIAAKELLSAGKTKRGHLILTADIDAYLKRRRPALPRADSN